MKAFVAFVLDKLQQHNCTYTEEDIEQAVEISSETSFFTFHEYKNLSLYRDLAFVFGTKEYSSFSIIPDQSIFLEQISEYVVNKMNKYDQSNSRDLFLEYFSIIAREWNLQDLWQEIVTIFELSATDDERMDDALYGITFWNTFGKCNSRELMRYLDDFLVPPLYEEIVETIINDENGGFVLSSILGSEYSLGNKPYILIYGEKKEEGDPSSSNLF